MLAYGIGAYGAGLYGREVALISDVVPPSIAGNYTVLVTDENLTVVGDPIYCWTSLDITLRFNEPATGILITPGFGWVRDQFVPGNRVVIIRNGSVLVAGPYEDWLHERSDDGDNGGDGVLTINFTDDLGPIVARTVYPDPVHTPAAQTLDNWTFTGNAEQALRTLVNLNAGPGALATRQVPNLVLGDVAGVGATITVTALRMQSLGDSAREIADVGGELGFRTRQVGTQILFEVYQPANKSGTARFSFGLGNMRYLAYEVKAPTTTAVAVGGQGTGGDTAMIERVNTADSATWGRFEGYVARPGTDPSADLQDDGDKALADGAPTTRLATNVSDLPDMRFGIEYGLGDIVTVEPWPGEQVVDLVRVVHLQVYATSGEYVSATIGNQAAVTDPAWVARVRDIDNRLGRLERTVTPV